MTLVVRAEDLAQILRQEGVEISDHPWKGLADGRLTPVQCLVARGISARRLWSILHGCQKWVSFNVADEIICALRKTEVFYTGELEVLDICLATGKPVPEKKPCGAKQSHENEKPERNRRIIQLYSQGVPQREIAQKEGISHPRVSQILKAAQCS